MSGIMSKLLFFLFVLMFGILAQARHIHPHQRARTEGMAEAAEIDGIPVDVLKNIKPNHFVPINNIIFFRSYEPCDDGFKRDLFGVCREVWD